MKLLIEHNKLQIIIDLINFHHKIIAITSNIRIFGVSEIKLQLKMFMQIFYFFFTNLNYKRNKTKTVHPTVIRA